LKPPNKSRKKFLKLPQYPGGKKAFDAFIKANLKYPEEALEKKIEGDVLVTYEVNDNGEVLNAGLKHGIGSGCDEEALRLIRMLQFSKTSNRGLRVKSRHTARIPFRLPKKSTATRITYHMTAKPSPKTSTETPAKNDYTWKVPLNPPE
jgi:TonB family protein